MFDADEIPEDVLGSMKKLWPSYSTCEPLPRALHLALAACIHAPLD